ncbi:MAG: hypothetical protein IJN02_05650 [Bacteroidales bacterium]|nr:hypothetical protein [Bacteroidales bacterium]MBQ6688703.1 hypothetical protein [Bacteroidales bacterium]
MNDCMYEKICSFLLNAGSVAEGIPDISVISSELGLEDFEIDNICYEFLGMDWKDVVDALYAGIIKFSY